MKKFMLWAITQLLFSHALCQDLIIIQLVSDDTNEPIMGATIRIDGYDGRLSSGQHGTFRLPNAAHTYRLTISHVGHETKNVTIPGYDRDSTVIRLVPKIEQLEEVLVSTGYQQLTKGGATGSFEHIDNPLFNRTVSTNVLERLADVVPGLIFNQGRGSGSGLRIRGQSTIFSNADPLIVIDNFPYYGNIENINPNDVESVTVLKDASAASIWGARAGNGVIVISTKSGQYGRQITGSANSNITFHQQPDVFHYPRMTTADYIDIERSLFQQGFYNSTENAINKTALSPVVELLISNRDGLVGDDVLERQIREWKMEDVRNDYEKHLYRTGLNRQYALSLNGGGMNNRFYVSAGYDGNLSTVVGDELRRITINASNTHKLLDEKLELSVGMYYSEHHNSQNSLGNISWLSSAEVYPYAALADNEGNPLPIVKDFRVGFINDAERNGLLNWQYYPLYELSNTDRGNRIRDYRLNVSANYQLIPGLKLLARYQYANSSSEAKVLYGEGSYYARSLINQFSQVEAGGGIVRYIPNGSILDRSYGSSSGHDLRGQLSFAKDIDIHSLNALLGGEVRQWDNHHISHRFYGYDDDLALHRTVDYTSNYPSYTNPASRNNIIPNNDGITSQTDRYVSYFANLGYSIRNRYSLSASARLDRSNLIGVRSNQKGSPFWSIGLSWEISDESFYQSGALPYLRLRTTYGYNGNLNKTVTAFTTIRHNSGNNTMTRLPYAQIINPPNPALRWERVQMFNLGLDFASRNRRISGSLEGFLKKGLDLIGDTPFPSSTGIRVFRGNTANTSGRGMDLSLQTKNVDSRFEWHTDFFLSHVLDVVTDYQVENTPFYYVQNTAIAPLEGKPLTALYSYRWAGLDHENGNPQGFVNGELSQDYGAIINQTVLADIVLNGSTRPTWFGAIRNTFAWGDFSISGNVNYRLSYYFRKHSVVYGNNQGLGGHGDYARRWQNPGDEQYTNVPSTPSVRNAARDNFYTYSEALVLNGSHIRLQDVNLTYNLRKSKHGNLPVDNIRLYIMASNLGIIWRHNDWGIDPDNQTLPMRKQFSFGLNIDF